jgi:hypothetical protein
MKIGTYGKLRKSPSVVGNLMCPTVFPAKDRPSLKKELSKINENPRKKYILVTNKYSSKSVPGLTGIVIRRRRKA